MPLKTIYTMFREECYTPTQILKRLNIVHMRRNGQLGHNHYSGYKKKAGIFIDTGLF